MPNIINPKGYIISADLVPLINTVSRKNPYLEFEVETLTNIIVYLQGEEVGNLRSMSHHDGKKQVVTYFVGNPHRKNRRITDERQLRNECVTTKFERAVSLAVEMFVHAPPRIHKATFCSAAVEYYKNRRASHESEMIVIAEKVKNERKNAGELNSVYHNEHLHAFMSVVCGVLTNNIDLKTYMSNLVDVDEFIKHQRLVAQYRRLTVSCELQGVYVELMPRNNSVRVYDLSHWQKPTWRFQGKPAGDALHSMSRLWYPNVDKLPQALAQPLAAIYAFGRSTPILGTGAAINETLYYIEENAIVL